MDLRRGEADRIYRGADAALIDLALSPDGKILASAGGEQIRTLTGESSNVAYGTSLAWLPDDRLVSGGFKAGRDLGPEDRRGTTIAENPHRPGQ